MGLWNWINENTTHPQVEAAKENALRRRMLEREEERENGLRRNMDRYTAGEFDAQPAGFEQSSGITWNQARPEDKISKQNLLRQVAPEPYWEAEAARMLPAKKLAPINVGAGGALVDPETNEEIYRNPGDGPKRRTGQFGNRLVDMDTGETIKEFAGDSESWNVLTDEMERSLGLNETGTYKRNSKGDVVAITQPKQDAPTETQAKYGYNARRVASSLAKVDEVLAKDSGAASSWALEQFTDGAITKATGIDALARKNINPNAQIVRNNMVDAIDAVITLGTGAAYTKEQLEAARNSYMPRPGEPPNVKQDKFRKLLEVYEQAKVNARTAGEDLPDPMTFATLFGVEGIGGVSPMQPENDPLGIRGR